MFTVLHSKEMYVSHEMSILPSTSLYNSTSYLEVCNSWMKAWRRQGYKRLENLKSEIIWKLLLSSQSRDVSEKRSIRSVLPELFSWKSRRTLGQKITKITSIFAQNRGKITEKSRKKVRFSAKNWPPHSFLLHFYVTI